MPKCSYNGTKAQDKYRDKLIESRNSIILTKAELTRLELIVVPLLKKDHSTYVIFEDLKEELPISVRTFFPMPVKSLLIQLHLIYQGKQDGKI